MYRDFLRYFTSTLNELNDVQQITYDSFELSKMTKVQMMHDNFFINPGMQLQKSYYKQRTVYFLYLRIKDYSLSSWRESDLKFENLLSCCVMLMLCRYSALYNERWKPRLKWRSMTGPCVLIKYFPFVSVCVL